MAKDYSKKMKESALIQQTEEYMDNEVFGEASASVGTQPVVGTKAELSGTAATAQPNSDANGGTPKSTVGAPELTKGVSVPIPYSLYDHLDAMKKRSQRTGNRLDRRTIGELVVMAVKEFCERNPL